MAKKETSEEKLIKKINDVNKKMEEVNQKPIEKAKKTLTKLDQEKIKKKNNPEKVPKEAKEETTIETKKTTFGLFEVITFTIAFAIIFCLLGYMVGNRNQNNYSDNPDAPSEEVQMFLEQYNQILDNYYEDVDKEELMKAAIQGMLSSLDDYSSFIGEESNSFNVTLEGSYEGVGIEISNDIIGNIVIRKVYENTPAARADLKVNDIIVRCNDIDMKGKTSSELVNMIAKQKVITLTIERDGQTFDVKVVKQKITLDSVKAEMLDDKIGYISMSVFANNTYSQFKTALEDLEAQGMEKLIIDVRNNGGGYLSTADSIISLFMDASHVIYQTDTKGKIEKFYSKGTVDKTYPIVVLQNGASASASEVLTSALQEQLHAYVIGDVSFGKGTVQQLQVVSGVGQYKFTTKKWLTSNGNWIHEVGITPDYAVSLSVDDYTTISKEEDTQLQAGIKYLQGH